MTKVKHYKREDVEYWYTSDFGYHREDGPAFISHGGKYKSWYIDGKRHRLDGPAVEHINAIKEWWISGKRIDCSSQEEFERLMRLKAFW